MVFKYTYEQMLEKAFKELPEVSAETTRFELPVVKGSLSGNKTVVTNINQIASQLRRDAEHVTRFLLRELATTGEQKGGEFVFIGKFRSEFLNNRVEKYVNEFVLCPQCKKPDTHLVKEQSVTHLICEACGAKSTVRTLK